MVTNPASRAIRSTSAKRSGWRGASTSSELGMAALIFAKAPRTADSSPRIVLPATRTVRFGDSRKKRSTRSRGLPCAARAGSSSESNFRLPVTVMCAGSAPRSTKRRADSSLCTQKRSTSASTRRKNGRTMRYRGYDRDEMRPLIITVFTPRRRHSRSRFGQISVSIMMKRRGRTSRSVRRTMKVQSNGK